MTINSHRIKTSFRLEVFTDLQYTFSIGICSLYKGKQSDITIAKTHESGITAFQVDYYGPIDGVIFFFEEHKEVRKYQMDIYEEQLGSCLGYQLIGFIDSSDYCTYVGALKYHHPSYVYSPKEYRLIHVNSETEILEMD